VDVAGGRGERGVDVRVSVNPDESDVLALAAVVLSDAAERTGGDGVISADGERSFVLFEGVQNFIGKLGAGGGDLPEIAGVGVAKVLLLREGDDDVSGVFHLMAKGFKLGLKTGDAHGGWAHVYATALLSEIERDADDTDFFLDDVWERCGNADHTGVRL
jgi:hypothetical protein